MARILLTTYGSYGDLHPFLAIGRVLHGRGDRVTLATHPDYREQVERQGFQFVPMPPGLEDVGPEEVWMNRVTHPITSTSFIVRELILPYLQASHDVIDSAAVDQDLIISHLLTFAAPVVAEARRIRWLSCALAPTMLLSARDPPVLGGLPLLPRAGRMSPALVRGLYRLVAMSTRGWFRPLRELRRSRGLDPGGSNALVRGFSRHGTLALFPRAFAEPQEDWPPCTRQIGFPLFDTPQESGLSVELERFLAAGEAPVVFTLGSTVVRAVTDFFRVAYAAARQLGIRAVFVAGESRQVPEAARIDPRVLITGYEAYSKVFSHAAVVVHPSGIGTTAQALASGRPQVCVPFANDQFDNARRVADLGAGVVLRARRVTVSRLANAIAAARQPSTVSAAAAARLRTTEPFVVQLGQAVNELTNLPYTS